MVDDRRLPERSPPQRPPRIAALDAARALGVVAMVVGHVLDAVVSLEAREGPALVAYWKARGLTAPLFLVAAGWAVTSSIARGSARGPAVVAGRLPRAALLLALGYGLRWPGWGAHLLEQGHPETWAHLLAFDALHAIAVALVVAAAALALPWTGREKAAALALLAVLSVALGMGGDAPLLPDPAALPRPVLPMALAQAAGGTSPFPAVPWAGYFFVGAIVGLLAGDAPGRRAAWLGGVGAALVAATGWTGVGTLPPGHPVLFVFRVGAVLLLLAALSAVPAALAARLAPLGRASLGVYAIHLPVVYGWSTLEGLAQLVGPTLAPAPALALAGAVLAASAATQRAGAEVLGSLGAGARALRDRLAAALGPAAAGRGREG